MCISQDRLGYAAVTNRPWDVSGWRQQIIISRSRRIFWVVWMLFSVLSLLSSSSNPCWESGRYIASSHLSQSAQAAVTKYHKLSGLNNRFLYLTVLEAKGFKVKVLEDPVSSESSLPASQMVSSCCTLTWPRAERCKLSLVSSYKSIDPPWRLHPHDPIIVRRPHHRTGSPWGLGIQYLSLGRTQTWQREKAEVGWSGGSSMGN